MTKIISVISTKGGEGKSTHAANLSGFFADSGLKTLLIDGDYAQPTASSYFKLRYEAPNGLFELLMQTVNYQEPQSIISHTEIDNLDLIISNDPYEQLKIAMMSAPDGRFRLRNILNLPLFNEYDVIIIDSQGARSIMLELVILATNHCSLAVVKPILPDVREFLRGTIAVFEGLQSYKTLGLSLPKIEILINCMDYTNLATNSVKGLAEIIEQKSFSEFDIPANVLNTHIYDLDIYKSAHAAGLPVHRLEYKTDRKSLSAAETIHNLACELLPEYSEKFQLTLVNQFQG